MFKEKPVAPLDKKTKEEMTPPSEHDARFSEVLGGGEYDELLLALEYYDEFQAETGQALHEYLSHNCENQEIVQVLEAGPGTGITTIQLIKADPRVRIISVDNELKMLEAVKAKFANVEELQERVKFVFSDILAYLESCEDGSLDAFASVYTLHNFKPDFRRQVLGEISKKLKPGGIFINGDKYARQAQMHQTDFDGEINNYKKFSIHADELEKAGDHKGASHFREVQQAWVKHADEDETNKITVDEQNDIFEELGFEDIKWGKRFDLVTTVSAIKK